MKQEREELDQKINNYYDYLEQVNKNEAEKKKKSSKSIKISNSNERSVKKKRNARCSI